MLRFSGRKKKLDVADRINGKEVTASALAKEFNLDKQRKIIQSKVRNYFTPTHPIREVNALLGREKEVQSIYDAIHTPARHVLVYGDRGVGKSSLAYVISRLIESDDYKVMVKRCDSKTTFLDLVADPLLECKGIDVNVLEVHHHRSTEGGLHAKLPGVHVGGGIEVGENRVISGATASAQSPSWVASRLAGEKVLYIIDELDALQSNQDRRQLGELLKHISDHPTSQFKLLLVGIAQTASELTAGHPSVPRHIIEIAVNRLSDHELIEIINQAEPNLTFRFSKEAKIEVARLSHGYPYFTHLLALKAAEQAVVLGHKIIELKHIEDARSLAVYDADSTLRNAYATATKDDKNGKFSKLLQAAAAASSTVITPAQLTNSYNNLFGEEIAIGSYVQRLVSEETDSIFKRVGSDRPVYQFHDPRMPSYIRLAQGTQFE